jgi:hypothetical protein
MNDPIARLNELVAQYGETDGLRVFQVEMRVARGLSPFAAPANQEATVSPFAALPAQVQAAAGGGTRKKPIERPVMLQADLRPLPRKLWPNFDKFLPRVREAIKRRQPGDPLPATIETIAAKLLYYFRTQGTGYAQKTYEALAQFSNCCVDTAFLGIRFLEVCGIIGITGSRVRDPETGDFRRAANVYFLREDTADEGGADSDVKAEPPKPASHVGGGIPMPHWLRRYASAVRLYVRSRGLNTSPQTQAHPAPT